MKNRFDDSENNDKINLATKLAMRSSCHIAVLNTRMCWVSGEEESEISSQGQANKKCFWQETEAIGLQQPRIGLRPQLRIEVQDARFDTGSTPLFL